MIRFGSLLLVLLCALAIPCSAGQGDLMLGFKGGLNSSKMGGDTVDSDLMDSKLGFSMGGVLEHDFSNAAGIQMEALYTQKGFETTDSGITVKLNLNYIEVPALLKFMIPPKGNTKVIPNAFIGPALAVQVDCNVSGESGGVEGKVSCSEAGFNTNDLDASAVFGVGLDFLSGETGRVTLDARYVLGLVNIIDETGVDAKNRTISVSAGYTVMLGK